jgi:hypothetical protein
MMHQRLTWHNTPSALPKITRAHIIPPVLVECAPLVSIAKTDSLEKTPDHHSPSRRSTRLDPTSLPWLQNTQIISQESIHPFLNLQPTKMTRPFLPHSNSCHHEQSISTLTLCHAYDTSHHRLTTGETITSNKKLMNNPVAQETRMMAFCKDFGSICQGNDKLDKKGRTQCWS